MVFSLPQGAPSLAGETRAMDKTQKSPESQGICGAPSWLVEWRGKGVTASSFPPQAAVSLQEDSVEEAVTTRQDQLVSWTQAF